MLGPVIKNVVGGGNNGGKREIKGKVVLMFKIVLDSDAIKVPGPVLDVWGLLVFLKLVSADQQQEDGSGKVGEGAHLEKGGPLAAGETEFQVSFKWEEGFGIPGAVIVENNHPNHIGNEFYLKAVTLEDVPGHGRVHFVCNSWVYPAIISLDKDRVFFSNKTYLPHEMPIALQKYREEELVALRGDGKGERKQWDRIYDYASYNDLADLPLHRRPILGGSDEFPYPRRGRTGRLPSLFDPEVESNVSLESGLNIYVPRDERFDHLKMSDFLGDGVKSLAHFIRPALETLFDREYESFEEVLKLYHGGIKFPAGPLLQAILDNIPSELLRQIFHVDSAGFFKYPVPQVIKEDKSAWRTDEEFAREMLAGVHPIFVRLLKEFPPTSKLDRKQYGNQNSTITTAHIENKLDGLTVEQAMKGNRLFILDHHDALMPYLGRINGTSTKTYATRTVLFLKNDGTLKPLAIELSLPDARGDEFGAVSKVYGPAEEGVEGSIWQLAKAYVGVNDAGYHQLISHWLHTHAVMEPFVIATNRQLSVVHPIYKLLHPHFRDTMFINAFARQALVNAGGLLESTHFQGRYAMELSSMIYKKWVFLDQALPRDLKKRGIAVDDPQAKHGLRLLIKDYPFAVDGLEIWSAIQKWVQGYCSFYYKTDKMVQEDPELQSWWKEIREEGHGDKRHEQDGWPKMQTLEDLIEASTIIIWIASALHAAVNFGQYPYGGYMPVRPTISRRFMPEKGSPKYAELESNPDQVFLKTITAQPQALLGISLIEILSRHASDEVYLGKRDTPEWTTDEAPLAAFEDFGKRLSEIEEEIIDKNKDEKLKNRVGPVNVPYTLLFPSSEAGLTGKGIPNSISI